RGAPRSRGPNKRGRFKCQDRQCLLGPRLRGDQQEACMDTFKALLITRDEATKKQTVAVAALSPADLMPGDVDVRVEYSTINYKDGLAITGKLPVVRRWPMIPGIDFAGTVTSSTHAEFKTGDEVILNGWGVGETHFGGYAQMARVSGDWLIKKP